MQSDRARSLARACIASYEAVRSGRVPTALVALPLVAVAALVDAHALGQLVVTALVPDAEEVTAAPPSAGEDEEEAPPLRTRSARPILERNPFDHLTGPLLRPESASGGAADARGDRLRRSRSFGAASASAVAGASESAPDPASLAGIRHVSGSEFAVQRAFIDDVLQGRTQLKPSARGVPVRENGRVVGVRLTGIRSDGLLGMLGIQNGDELRSVNGLEVGTPDKALDAYSRLANARRITLEIQRGGATIHLAYTID